MHTNHISKDEVHVPPTSREVQLPWGKTKTALSIFKHLILGWPFYLLKNVASNKRFKGQSNVNHFSPWSPLFTEEQRPYIILSDIGIVLTIAGLSVLGFKYGTPAVAVLYLGPYLIVNMWLVLITKLQHTANDVPVYDETTFTWVKGQLCTVDRDFGWLLNAYVNLFQFFRYTATLSITFPPYSSESMHLDDGN